MSDNKLKIWLAQCFITINPILLISPGQHFLSMHHDIIHSLAIRIDILHEKIKHFFYALENNMMDCHIKYIFLLKIVVNTMYCSSNMFPDISVVNIS